MKMKKIGNCCGLFGFFKKAAAACLASAVCITSLPADNLGIVLAAGTPAERPDSSIVYFVDCGDYVVEDEPHAADPAHQCREYEFPRRPAQSRWGEQPVSRIGRMPGRRDGRNSE